MRDPFAPAVELAAAIRRKEVSPVEAADCYLARIDEPDPRLNAFCHRAGDDVREAGPREWTTTVPWARARPS